MSISTKTVKGKKKYQYREYYKDSTGTNKQHNSKWFDTKYECIQERDKFRLNKKNIVSCSDITFLELSDLYFSSLENDIKPRYLNQRKKIIENHCAYLHNLKVDEITLNDCQHFKNLLDQDEELHSTTYKNKIISLCYSIIEYGQKHYDIQENNFIKLDRFKKTDKEKIKKDELNVLDPKEFKDFLAAAKAYKNGKHIEKCNALEFIYLTGLRKNECLSLTFEDIEKNCVNVTRQYDPTKKEFVSLKSLASKRKIRINKRCIDIVKYQKKLYKSIPGYNETWFLFGGYKYMCNTSIQKFKNNVVNTYNLKPFRIHDLRHSHATFLIANDTPIYNISKRLGHDNVNITAQTYIHYIDDNEKDILNLLDTI